jgi:hypothetical protein
LGRFFRKQPTNIRAYPGSPLLNIGRALFSPASDGRLKDAGRANQAAKMMDDGTLPGSAYRVTLDKDDRLVWTAENNREKVQYDKDPETNVWERLLFDFVGMLPIEDQL